MVPLCRFDFRFVKPTLICSVGDMDFFLEESRRQHIYYLLFGYVFLLHAQFVRSLIPWYRTLSVRYPDLSHSLLHYVQTEWNLFVLDNDKDSTFDGPGFLPVFFFSGRVGTSIFKFLPPAPTITHINSSLDLCPITKVKPESLINPNDKNYLYIHSHI